MKDISKIDFSPEFQFNTSRSSGAGGQNVNKVETKVELRFSVENSTLLDEAEKEKVRQRLKNQINKEGELVLVCQESRSQLKNKKLIISRFIELITQASTIRKKRKPTQPTLEKIEKRLKTKKLNADKKEMRMKLRF